MRLRDEGKSVKNQTHAGDSRCINISVTSFGSVANVFLSPQIVYIYVFHESKGEKHSGKLSNQMYFMVLKYLKTFILMFETLKGLKPEQKAPLLFSFCCTWKVLLLAPVGVK